MKLLRTRKPIFERLRKLGASNTALNERTMQQRQLIERLRVELLTDADAFRHLYTEVQQLTTAARDVNEVQ